MASHGFFAAHEVLWCTWHWPMITVWWMAVRLFFVVNGKVHGPSFFCTEGVGGKSDAMYSFLKTDEITLICLLVFILMIRLDSRCLVFSYIWWYYCCPIFELIYYISIYTCIYIHIFDHICVHVFARFRISELVFKIKWFIHRSTSFLRGRRSLSFAWFVIRSRTEFCWWLLRTNGKLGKSSSVNVTSLDLCWKSTRKKLGGGFKHFNIFTPYHGEMIHFDVRIFFRRVVQPPTEKLNIGILGYYTPAI